MGQCGELQKALGKHNFDAMAGSSWTQSKWSQNYINGSNYANDNFPTLNAANKISWTETGSSAADWAIFSTFARLQYNWNDTYMVTANIVLMVFKLAPHHRWGLFPSFSGVGCENEKFMKDISG